MQDTSRGRVPYQGHVYPDGTCLSVAEVAAILNPEGFEGDAKAIAGKAGFAAISGPEPEAE